MKRFTFLFNLKFAIFLLLLLSITSSIGSIIEQNKSDFYYMENYSSIKPIWGFIDYKIILFLGLNHLYENFWFFSLLLLLALSLLGCTITRQLPLITISKNYFFKKKVKNFNKLPILNSIKKNYFSFECIIIKLQLFKFFIYQQKHLLYAYKGLIGRVSPILVHFSILLILVATAFSAFKNFKVEEFIPKGEIFSFQNFINLGFFGMIPRIYFRINDFWIEYNSTYLPTQYYANISILNNFGNELFRETLSINNPLIYKNNYFYQNEWLLSFLRVIQFYDFSFHSKLILNYPLFPLKGISKFWISFINDSLIFLFDLLSENYYFLTENFPEFLENYFYKEYNNLKIIDIISFTGILIKYDFSIGLTYFGFFLLICTTFLSYLPYNQVFLIEKKKKKWIGSLSNRKKILELKIFLSKNKNYI